MPRSAANMEPPASPGPILKGAPHPDAISSLTNMDLSTSTFQSGMPNMNYKFSNGNIGMHPRLSMHRSSSGKTPVSRVSSCQSAASTSRFDTGSVMRLVFNRSDRSGCQILNSPVKKIGALCFVLIMVTTTLATLYLLEAQREKVAINLDGVKEVPVKEVPKRCLRKPKPLDLRTFAEPEIKSAILKSGHDIMLSVLQKDYYAVSTIVEYAGRRVWYFNDGAMSFKVPKSRTPSGDTPYPIASITKIFTVIALHQLAERGFIRSIDDYVSDYVPDFQVINPFDDEKITFRQLSCMTSGLPREAPCGEMAGENFCPLATKEMLRRISNITLRFRPGQQPSYSNLAVSVLGRSLEFVMPGNATFESWVEAQIFKPLNMTSSGFDLINRTEDFPASSLLNGEDLTVNDWGWLRPTGGMYSTTEDLSKLNAFLLGLTETTVLRRSTALRLLKPEYIHSDGSAQGCPFEVISMTPPSANQTQVRYLGYFKDGTVFGYGGVLGVIPELQLSVTMLYSKPKAENPLPQMIISSFVDAFHSVLDRLQAQYILPKHAEDFVGSYRLDSYWPFVVRPCNISLANNKLLVNLEWMTASLGHESDWVTNTFAFEMPSSTMCNLESSGLLGDRYIFDPPVSEGSRSPGFMVEGITTYGFARFSRIGSL